MIRKYGRWFEVKMKNGEVRLLSEAEIEATKEEGFGENDIEEVRTELTDKEIEQYCR